jgi:hypothetical protein
VDRGGVLLGSKAIAVLGTLEMYGAPVLPPWTTLAVPAAKGDNQIIVPGFVGWKAGDQLSIASSTFEVWEVRFISAPFPFAPSRVRFNAPLAPVGAAEKSNFVRV